MSINFEEEFIAVDKSRSFLICGKIHYFRMPKSLWYDILLKAKKSGVKL